MSFQPSESLTNRTFIGLILSQFLAAFNDQAIHIVAIFYAGDMLVHFASIPYFDEKLVITLVTACFITPFFLFSPLAGILADKYSKQRSLVFWKVAEVGMMLLALVGFLLPHFSGLSDPHTLAIVSAALVVTTVFLMGTHSAFFVPAKYGVMPEILLPTVLSRGNGLLEGTSFVANILGTVIGGLLYVSLKSTRLPTGELALGKEWWIGVLLVILSLIGVKGSLMIAKMPAAAPELPLTWKLWIPLMKNLGVLLRSRPLALSVIGIAFFSFMTLFLRQTLIYEGETNKELQKARTWKTKVDNAQAKSEVNIDDDGFPAETSVGLSVGGEGVSENQKAELRVTILVAMVGLGVGIGSTIAGYVSGHKVELGLTPIGAICLIISTAILAVLIHRVALTMVCLVFVGIAGGFYIVPLYTLLQHRAPKDSKGNLVATSNFVNVAGGLSAVFLFFLATFLLERFHGIAITEKMVEQNVALLPTYLEEIHAQVRIPAYLFVTSSLFTLAMLVVLCRMLPDFFVRALVLLRSRGVFKQSVSGLKHVPSDGPAILVTNCDEFENAMRVVVATDRFTQYVLFESRPDHEPRPLMRYLAKQTGFLALKAAEVSEADLERAIGETGATLAAGDMVGWTLDGAGQSSRFDQAFESMRRSSSAPILPVRFDPAILGEPGVARRAKIRFGAPLPPTATLTEIRDAIDQLRGEERA